MLLRVRQRSPKVPGITDAVAIAGGPTTTCLMHENGKLSCWGNFLATSFSDDQTTIQACQGHVPYPVDVPIADKIDQISFGDRHVCLIGERDGYKGVMCHGSNEYYQLGCVADYIWCPGREKNPVTGEFAPDNLVYDIGAGFDSARSFVHLE